MLWKVTFKWIYYYIDRIYQVITIFKWQLLESSMYVIIFNIQNVNILSLTNANKTYFCRIDSFILPLYGN